ncbi:MAG: hypothetical protein ACK50J_02170 [Planctomyces sp.]
MWRDETCRDENDPTGNRRGGTGRIAQRQCLDGRNSASTRGFMVLIEKTENTHLK